MKIAPIPESRQPALTDGMSPELHISYQVTIVDNLMAFANSTKNVKDFGLNIRQWRVLGCIAQLGPVTARQIIETTHQDKATVSRAIAELSHEQLIVKLPNKLHKRSPLIWLSVKGKALFDELYPIFENQAMLFTQVLSAKEKLQLCGLLDKLKNHIEITREEMGLY